MNLSDQYNTANESDKYKLLFLWSLCNIIFPEIIRLIEFVTLDNFRMAIPTTMIALQLSNFLYYKLSKKVFYTTIALNFVGLALIGAYTVFYAVFSLPLFLEHYYLLYLQYTAI